MTDYSTTTADYTGDADAMEVDDKIPAASATPSSEEALPANSTYHVYRPLHLLELLIHNFGQRLGNAAFSLSEPWTKLSNRNQADKLREMGGARTRWAQDRTVKTRCQEELVRYTCV